MIYTYIHNLIAHKLSNFYIIYLIYVRNIYIKMRFEDSEKKIAGRTTTHACSSVSNADVSFTAKEKLLERCISYYTSMAIGQDIGLPQRARRPRLDFYVTHSALKRNAR